MGTKSNGHLYSDTEGFTITSSISVSTCLSISSFWLLGVL